MALTRRHCIKSFGLMALGSTTSLSLLSRQTIEYPWQSLLEVSLFGEYDYLPEVEGYIPPYWQGHCIEMARGYLNAAVIENSIFWTVMA